MFWKSGQTKIEGLAIDIVEGTFQLGCRACRSRRWTCSATNTSCRCWRPNWAPRWPPLGEHVLPLLLLLGLGTRFAALGLLVMTAVIQLLVYPGAWPDARRLGGGAAVADGAGAGRGLAGPLAGPPPRLTPGATYHSICQRQPQPRQQTRMRAGASSSEPASTVARASAAGGSTAQRP